MFWIKGKANYNGKEIINDSDLWHSIEEVHSQVYVDGELRISQSDIILELLEKAKNK